MRAGKEDVMEKEAEAPAEKGALQQAAAPEFDKKCTIAGGVPPGSKTVSDNTVVVTYRNTGRVANEGTYFEFTSADGTKNYRKNTDALAPQESIVYTVDLNSVAQELGSAVKTFAIYPIQGGKACLNQPAFVIK